MLMTLYNILSIFKPTIWLPSWLPLYHMGEVHIDLFLIGEIILLTLHGYQRNKWMQYHKNDALVVIGNGPNDINVKKQNCSQ